MSIKLDLEINCIPGEKIVRVRRAERQNKPVSLGIISYDIYPNEAAKAADCPLVSNSKDVDPLVLSGDDLIIAAYTWLKSNLFPGATDC